MKNVVSAILIAAVFACGIFFSFRRLRNRGGCCSSSAYRPKKKKLDKIVEKKTFRITGMKCENCKYRIEETVNDVSGVAARADLKRGTLTVLYSHPVADEEIKKKIERLGYGVFDASPHDET